MTIRDLDGTHHPATIEGERIHVGHLSFDADGFTTSGLILVDYDEEEEAQLVAIGLLTQRQRLLPAGCHKD